MAKIDAATQRMNMVESQVRPSDVTDRRIIRAMLEVPREAFVPTALKTLAYMDDTLMLAKAEGASPARGLMAPRAFAKLVQLADLSSDSVVLDVGCATGYSTAVIAKLAQTVVALEADAVLAETATKTLESLGFDNVAVVTGSHDAGYASEGPYDAIVVAGAVEEIPPVLLDQLKDGGRLVAVIAGVPGRATVWRRIGRHYDKRAAFEASAPAVPGFEVKREFVF